MEFLQTIISYLTIAAAFISSIFSWGDAAMIPFANDYKKALLTIKNNHPNVHISEDAKVGFLSQFYRNFWNEEHTVYEEMEELGFEIEEFGENTILLRQIPMDLSPDDAAEAIEALSADLLSGRREKKDTVRDEILHTVACKAAIKAGWKNDEAELLALAKQVMAREDLKYCPHGRPICITLSKKQLEKQFKRS